jgi:hypothetical protein
VDGWLIELGGRDLGIRLTGKAITNPKQNDSEKKP